MDPTGLTSIKKLVKIHILGISLANHAAKKPLEQCPNHESNVQKNNIRMMTTQEGQMDHDSTIDWLCDFSSRGARNSRLQKLPFILKKCKETLVGGFNPVEKY